MKYRHKILYPKVEMKLIQILCKIEEDNNFKIMEVSTDFDHIHLLTECTPQHYIPDIPKALKGERKVVTAGIWR